MAKYLKIYLKINTIDDNTDFYLYFIKTLLDLPNKVFVKKGKYNIFNNLNS